MVWAFLHLWEKTMRYHYEKPHLYNTMYGKIYICDHPAYNRCTLYEINGVGLGVIQQRFNPRTKRSWWTEIDEWLTDDIFVQPGFKDYFDKHGGPCEDGLYPTVTVRQIMWALRMKPIKKERWETVFDRNGV